MTMQVQCYLIYPAVKRELPENSDIEKYIPIELNIGCDTWKTNTAMRKGFCELVFAGAGNHPGNESDQMAGYEFDSGDKGINNVHRQWALARTRSMSVGDILKIDIGEQDEYWLCDSVGFVLLTPDQAGSWLNYPRKYGCCSFELNQWLKKQTA